jgi:putative FmdB family regulatory protein
MPTYEYECTSCGYSFEISQKMTDKHLDKCPKCSKKLRRLIGAGAGIIFSRHNNFYTLGRDSDRKLSSEAGKGSGFYATDYKKDKSKGSKTQADICPKAKEGCSGCQHLH